MRTEGGFLGRGSDIYKGGPEEGLLQRVDPAFRLVGAIILLLGIGVCREPVALMLIFASAIILAVTSFLNLRSIYHVMLVPVLLLALPAWVFASLWYGHWGIGSIFFIRTVASISVASVALHSIGLKQIAGVLESFRVPYEIRQMWTIMVAQVETFSGVVAEMAFARKARQLVKPPGRVVRVQVGRQAGIMFSRTWHRGNALASAMDARAIGAKPRGLIHRHPTLPRDYVFLLCCSALTAGLMAV